jgi:zinc transport system substrate-binding protein
MHGLGGRIARALLVGGIAGAPGVPAASALEVVVTIKPLHALVARVMSGAGTPQLLVQGALSPHTYVLKPSDAAKLNSADILFRMSETMEPFTAKVVKSLPRRVQTVTLQDTPALVLLGRRAGATFEASGEAEGNHHHGHSQGAIDGHAWLDPVNAKTMVGRIEEALSAKDPARAAVFRANAEALRADLDALSAELARELAPVAGKPYVVLHDALQYFELRYRLTAAGSITVSPEMPPSAKRLSILRRELGARRAECVFAEPQFETRLVDSVVEGTPARVGTIDPEGARIEPGPDLYFTLLRNLAKDLKACLAPAG